MTKSEIYEEIFFCIKFFSRNRLRMFQNVFQNEKLEIRNFSRHNFLLGLSYTEVNFLMKGLLIEERANM